MFRLTREVRFSLNAPPDRQLGGKVSNGFGGFPTMTGLGRFYTAQVTLAGPLATDSQYLLNIKDIDDVVRGWLAERLSKDWEQQSPVVLVEGLAEHLRGTWGERLWGVRLALTPLLAVSVSQPEFSMLHLSQKFEFSASHRLHNPALSEAENRELYGKCNNPLGHGHNYEVQVTVVGTRRGIADAVVSLPVLERVVEETVIARFDHKHLNLEVTEFATLIPTVENIARVIYHLLQPKIAGTGGALQSVTVWETPKTWCEFSE